MTVNGAHSRKAASSRTLRVLGFALCLTALFAVLFCYRWLLHFDPPDLNGCTRVDITYYPSALRYLVPGIGGDSLFSQAEKAYLESLETFSTSDKELIKDLAFDLRLGVYNGRKRLYRPAVHITCYREAKLLVSFYTFDRTVITEHGHRFEYPTGLRSLDTMEPLRMQGLKLRLYCARNMGGLQTAGPLRYTKAVSYPAPNQWCDSVVQFCRNQYAIRDGVKTRRFNENWIGETLLCPSALKHGGTEPNFSRNDPLPFESHYALNPHCEPNSPPDTVLLFETGGGWNQHGGREFFTFDNHDPKGGCVLLNDGTVKFIRTEEELQQLRWK